MKPSAYGRGGGYALWDEWRCNNDNPQGCEKWGLMWYPKCAYGFHNVACCVCSPNCVDGMPDIGISCQKNSYGRGVGTPLGCGHGEENNASLCYPNCRQGFDGNGPICWEKCPSGTIECGALCVLYESTCTDTVKNTVQDVFSMVAELVKEGFEGEIDMQKLIEHGGSIFLDLATVVCDDPEEEWWTNYNTSKSELPS